jgi:hypothetical protein
MRLPFLLPLLSFAALGCGSPPTEGTAALRFAVTKGVRQSPSLTRPLQGTVRGSLFNTEEVTVVGPIKGAKSVASVTVAGVDLRTAELSTANWTSAPILAGQYTFLGYYDLSGMGGDEPAAGDPVTLPTTNRMNITAGQQIDFTVAFDLVYN